MISFLNGIYHITAFFSSSLRSKKRTAQINEVLLKILCHNLCVVIQEIHEISL